MRKLALRGLLALTMLWALPGPAGEARAAVRGPRAAARGAERILD